MWHGSIVASTTMMGFYLLLLILFELSSILNVKFTRKPTIKTKKAVVIRNLHDILKVSNADILALLVASCPPTNVCIYLRTQTSPLCVF